MDYSLEKVEKGTAIPKDALNICTLMGLMTAEIIDTAKEINVAQQGGDKYGKASLILNFDTVVRLETVLTT